MQKLGNIFSHYQDIYDWYHHLINRQTNGLFYTEVYGEKRV